MRDAKGTGKKNKQKLCDYCSKPFHVFVNANRNRKSRAVARGWNDKGGNMVDHDLCIECFRALIQVSEDEQNTFRRNGRSYL